MKYIVVKAQTMKDGTVATVSNAYDTLREAEGAYFYELASASASDALAGDYAAVIGSTGFIHHTCFVGVDA